MMATLVAIRSAAICTMKAALPPICRAISTCRCTDALRLICRQPGGRDVYLINIWLGTCPPPLIRTFVFARDAGGAEFVIFLACWGCTCSISAVSFLVQWSERTEFFEHCSSIGLRLQHILPTLTTRFISWLVGKGKRLWMVGSNLRIEAGATGKFWLSNVCVTITVVLAHIELRMLPVPGVLSPISINRDRHGRTALCGIAVGIGALWPQIRLRFIDNQRRQGPIPQKLSAVFWRHILFYPESCRIVKWILIGAVGADVVSFAAGGLANAANRRDSFFLDLLSRFSGLAATSRWMAAGLQKKVESLEI